ncbi:hypothetical protein G9A89_017991 [Geosiphon pyriformis]|nr:hypothetical protein G9A89_017991 [Geosiphon pyriformis]
MPDLWSRQYAPLDYVVDNAFSRIMNEIKLDDLCAVVKNLPDDKAAGLLGKRCLTNTWPIALIETAYKILSKIFSDHIFLACNTFNVLRGDNFSVLKGTSTQLSMFVIGSIIEDVLKKNRELWLVITDFGLSDSYKVLNGLDQGEVFSLLLWRIFYDPLLCEIKSQEHLCEYRIDSKFVAKSDKVESQTEITSFFAAKVFMNDTIWVGSSQAATQHILNVSLDLQVASWLPVHLLCHPIRLQKWLDLCGSVLVWFDSAIHFLGARLLAANVKPYMSVVCLVYSVVASAINSFVKQFGSCFVIAGAAAFFSKFGLSGVMSSTLVELKVIALTLACLSSGSSVFIHFDSQAALSAFNFIRRKSLAMAWLKVKDYSGILGNEHANEIVSDAC